VPSQLALFASQRVLSKVVPVREALDVKQWVLPTEQVVEFQRNARSFALTPCTCRSRYQHCNNPLEV
jgi:hypothetical protein